MADLRVQYFDRPGPRNTAATLEAVAWRVSELGIAQLVVASNTGATALAAAQRMPHLRRIVGVTEHAGWWETDTPPDPVVIAEAQRAGVTVLTCSHPLMGGVDWAVYKQHRGLPEGHLIARTYYTFSQGFKVAVECALMAADAGLLDMSGDAVAVAGTGKGADTALVIKPAHTNRWFDLRVREVLAMLRS